MRKIKNALWLTILLLLVNAGTVHAKTIKCGNLPEMNAKIPNLVSECVKIVFVAVPVILVVAGVIDLVKGIMSAKEDEIKKGQNLFIKKLITGVLIYFVFAIVSLVVTAVSDDSNAEKESMMKCVNCFINGCKK